MTTFAYLTLPARGHLNPSLPVIAELARRGNTVHCFSLPSFRPAIEHAGAIFHDYGSRCHFPANGVGPFARLDTTIDALIDLTRAVVEQHLDSIAQLRPDCILHDSFSPWGRFLAQALHRPAVASVPSIAVNEQIARGTPMAAEMHSVIGAKMPLWLSALAELNQRLGVSAIFHPFELMHAYSELNLVYTSRAFQPMAGAFEEQRFKFAGPSIAARADTAAFPFEALDGRPLLLISLGSVYDDRAAFFHSCAEAFAGSAWQVVMAAGQSTAAVGAGWLPENVILREWVPQLELLRQTKVFVTHAGMNSVSEALWHGVPLVTVPQSADQFWIAARTAEIGAGISLGGGDLTPARLREAVDTLASQPSYRQAAAVIGESLRAAGGPPRAADEVEAFLRRREGAGI